MGSKLSAMGVSGVGTRLVSGGMGGHRNSISFDRSGEFLFCLLFASSIESIWTMRRSAYSNSDLICF